jgi:hypothetical protein
MNASLESISGSRNGMSNCEKGAIDLDEWESESEVMKNPYLIEE